VFFHSLCFVSYSFAFAPLSNKDDFSEKKKNQGKKKKASPKSTVSLEQDLA
jgi:hypothetical protein